MGVQLSEVKFDISQPYYYEYGLGPPQLHHPSQSYALNSGRDKDTSAPMSQTASNAIQLLNKAVELFSSRKHILLGIVMINFFCGVALHIIHTI